MNKLKTMLLTLVTLFAFTNVSNAFSLGGTYLEVGSSAVGAAFDGDFTMDLKRQRVHLVKQQ